MANVTRVSWNYEAHDKLGQPSVGTIEAATEQEAAELLRAAGLYAREISLDPVRAKYEHGATGGEAGHKPGDEHPLPAAAMAPEPPGPVEAPDQNGFSSAHGVPHQPSSPGGLPNLARELEAISRVAARMAEWEQAYRAAKPGDPLPSGVPSVGGKTWDIYNARMGEHVNALLLDALRHGVVEAKS